MKMMNFNNAFNNEFITKIFEINKNYTLLKNIIEEENKFDPKYKTELCKKFQSTGKCPYGYKCRFAHGKQELLSKSQSANYKKKPCKTFNEKGYCPYGSRCSFRHDERKFSETSFSYFYLQLFLFKKYNFLPSRKNFYLNQSNLLNKRLPVFESFTINLSNQNAQHEHTDDKYNNEIIDKNNSFSTISNTSNEEVEPKKGFNNDLELVGFFQNDEIDKSSKEKMTTTCKMDDKTLFNEKVYKENIPENINF
jgi:hypothetical protein